MAEASVIVCARNAEKTLKECVDSVLVQEFKDFELIVVDDCSTDSTPQIMEKFSSNPKMKYIRLKECVSIGKARNTGIKNAKGEFVVFIDSDCVAEKNCLSELLKGFGEEKIAGVGGVNLTPKKQNENGKIAGKVLESLSGAGSLYIKKPSSPEFVSHIASCNSAYRKTALESAGGFNEGIASNEDPELDYRLTRKGLLLRFNPKAVVWHYRRDTVKGFFRQAYWFGKGRAQITRIHPKMLEFFRILPSLAVIWFAAFLLLGFFEPLYWLAFAGSFLAVLTGMLVFSIYLASKTKMVFLHKFFAMLCAWLLGYALGFLAGLSK